MTLGKKLFNLRHDRGLTIQQLAAKAKVTDGKISKLERGVGAAYHNGLFRIARALNVPYEYLIDDSQPYPYEPLRYRESKEGVESKARTRMHLTRDEAAFLKALWQTSAEARELVFAIPEACLEVLCIAHRIVLRESRKVSSKGTVAD